MARSGLLVTAILLTLAAAPALASRELARTSGCFDCHGLSQHSLGPAFRAIAQRYASKLGADETLYKSIKYGEKGQWARVSGGAPMPPHNRRLSDDEIRELVDWILGL